MKFLNEIEPQLSPKGLLIQAHEVPIHFRDPLNLIPCGLTGNVIFEDKMEKVSAVISEYECPECGTIFTALTL